MITENTQPKSCPKCGYVLDPRDTECPRCVRLRQPRPPAKEPFSKGTLFACLLFLAFDGLAALWVLKNGIMLRYEQPAIRLMNGAAFDDVLRSYLIFNLLLVIPALARIFGYIGFLRRRRSGAVSIFAGYLLDLIAMGWVTLHFIPLLLGVQRWYGFMLEDDFYAGAGNGVIAIAWMVWAVLRLAPALILRSVVMGNFEKLDAPAKGRKK